MTAANEQIRDLDRAVVVFLGYARATRPLRDEFSLAREFGAVRARRLVELIAALQREMHAIDIDWKTHSLVEASDAARAEMKRQHPELADEALNALAWAFRYAWRPGGPPRRI